MSAWFGITLMAIAVVVIVYVIFWSIRHVNDPVDWDPLDPSEYDDEDGGTYHEWVDAPEDDENRR